MHDNSLDIVFTVDYEIHGNGSGSFIDFCYMPIERMLDLANEFKVKITLMVEMEHYFAMELYENIFSSEIMLFRKQLKRAIVEGHDVQLHLHPQWRNAKYKDGWSFPYTHTQISYLCDDVEYAIERIKKAKKWLEDYLRDFKEDYQCIGFRAGYFQIQPSINIYKALNSNGICCDTSVFKGFYRNSNNTSTINFRKVEGFNEPYMVEPYDFSLSGNNSNILELPIFSRKETVFKYYLKSRKYKKIINQIVTKKIKIKKITNSTKSPKKQFFVFNLFKFMYWDFCKDNPLQIKKSIKKIKLKNKDQPIILIGHSKDFIFSNNFRILLLELTKMGNCNFVTLSNTIGKYYEC